MNRRFRAAFSVVICALLCGCSLFGEDSEANVYLPGSIVAPAASSSSSISSDQNQYVTGNTPPKASTSSSSSSRTPTPAAPTEPVQTAAPIERYREKWYYNHINYKRQWVYERLYECAKSNTEICDVSDLDVSDDDVYAAYWAFDLENPQFLELGSGYEITFLNSKVSNRVRSIKINYGRKPSAVSQEQFDARAEAVLEQARTLSSDYEKLKYVHDWLVSNTVYTKSGEAYEREADGPVVYGRALCEGYSKAFMYFAQSLGFPCICSVGEGRLMEPHMWNMVKLGGKWYNVDVTWDDPVGFVGTANTGGSQNGGDISQDYFLISDALIRIDHRVEHPLLLPNAPDGYFPYGYDGNDSNNGSNTASSQP